MELFFLRKSSRICLRNYEPGPRRLAHGSMDPSLNVGRSTLDGRMRLKREGVSFSFNLGRWLGFRWLGFKMPNLYGQSNLGRSSKI
jgi:hypothetical protein